MNPKLSHLTHDEIRALIRKYYDGEKIQQLISEYQLNVKASELVKIFPPKVCDDLYCPYCSNTNLTLKYESRQYKSINNGIPECPVCRHVNNNNCNCGGCRERKYVEKEKIDNRKKQLINDYNSSKILISTSVKDLTLENAIYLIALTRHSLSEDLRLVKIFDRTPVKFAPTEKLTEIILNSLYDSGLINISPESNLDYFFFNEELTSITGYYPTRILWEFLPLLSIQEKRAFVAELERRLEDLFKNEEYNLASFKLWHLIWLHECIEYYYFLLESRSYPFEIIGDKTEAAFKSLIRKMSLGKIFNLSWQSIRNTVDFIKRKAIPQSQVASVFTGILLRTMDRSLAEKWDLKDSRRDFSCSQTVISSTYFNLFLKLGDSAIKLVAPEIHNEDNFLNELES